MVKRLLPLFLGCLLGHGAWARDASYDKTTAAILITSAGALLAWDAYLGVRGARTESMVIMDAAWRASALPYATCGVAAHLFGNLPNSTERRWPIAVASLVMVIGIDLLVHTEPRESWRHPGLWCAMGAGMGMLAWGQKW